MANKPIKSDQFSDLSARGFARGEEDSDSFLADDRDPDQIVASVDLSESDIAKAISTGFGAEVPDDDEELDSKSKNGDGAEETDSKASRRDAGEDDQSFSKKTRKRIERERRNTQRERQQRIDLQRERDELRDRLERLEAKAGEQDDAKLEGEVQRHDRELGDLETRLAKASEEGEHAEVAKLTRQMQEAAAGRAEAQRRKDAAVAARREGGDRGADRGEARVTKRAQDVIDANRDWWDDKSRATDRQVVLAIDAEVNNDGFDKETPEYYAEIVKRSRARGVELELPKWLSEDDVADEEQDDNRDVRDRRRTRDRDEPRRRPARRGPGGMGGGGRKMSDEDRDLQREASGKVTLTIRDRQQMARFRLDPDNAEHVRQFARSRQETARKELARRG